MKIVDADDRDKALWLRKWEYEQHHSSTDSGARDFAERVFENLNLLVQGKPVPNKWLSADLEPGEILSDAAYTINQLCLIIDRLANKHCDTCGGVGYVSERMGGCRDDKEEVICPKCRGRWKPAEAQNAQED